MTNKNDTVLGTGASLLTPSGYQVRPKVELSICNSQVPPAAPSMIGKCPYYYQPLHGEYLETVEKVSVSSAWETVKAFATSWDPWKDKEVARRLLHRREQLIAPESTDTDWSRHGNFMMRHIGCGHKPPSYYVSYGYYYCSHYGRELFPKLSPAGKEWLVLARKFLQKNLEKGLAQNMQGNVIKLSSQTAGNGQFSMDVPQYQLELDEGTFKEFAFKTHPLAYLDGGIAHLPLTDLCRITRQPSLQEWGSWATYEQVGKTGWGSAKTWASDSADAVSSGAEDMVNRALEFLMAK
jgi:hypothetical protein